MDIENVGIVVLALALLGIAAFLLLIVTSAIRILSMEVVDAVNSITKIFTSFRRLIFKKEDTGRSRTILNGS